jgi:Putative zinc-finger/FecR protein
MWCRHVIRHLSAYFHGELEVREKIRVEEHLRDCSRCRESYDQIRFTGEVLSTLSTTPAPDSLWRELATRGPVAGRVSWLTPLAGLAVALFLALGLHWYVIGHTPASVPEGPAWEVANVRGTPRIGSVYLHQKGSLRAGQTLQTDGSSQAEVQIANIGRLYVEPDTRLRLLVTKSDEHRIALDHGKVEATTWSPPRLFVIDTPSGSAVDLGCRYILEVQKDGSALLHVTLGMVALNHDGREAFVPDHFLARTRSGFGPGTPFREDSPAELRAALDAIDFDRDSRESRRQVAAVLAATNDRDAVTLWHLLSRIDSQDRSAVYDRLSSIVRPPSEVTRTGIVALDSRMLRAWGEAIPELFWMKETAHEND